jgi:hypothetical protein
MLALGASTIVLFLMVGDTARAQTRSDLLSVLASWVSGRTIEVSCETNWPAWRQELAAGALPLGSDAYYEPNDDVIRIGPTACNAIASAVRGLTLARAAALFIVAHEAAHAAGVEDEGTANCWGLYWTQDLARRVYGVEFFTAQSRKVLAWARQIQRDAPPEYRAACPVK